MIIARIVWSSVIALTVLGVAAYAVYVIHRFYSLPELKGRREQIL